jgi:hypothetical protein
VEQISNKLTPELIERGRLLDAKSVLAIWPISREWLSILTNHPNPAKRIPSYKYGRRVFYAYEELMHYRDNHRYEPKPSRKEKTDAITRD